MKQYILIIDGPSGSGKSTVGDLLTKKMKRTAVINSDKIKWFLSDYDRSEADQNIIGNVLRAMCEAYLAAGINVLMPQGFWKKEYIEPYIRIAKKHKVNFFIYHLDAPRALLLERIANRPKQKDARTKIPQKRILSNLDKWGKYKYKVEKTFDTSVLTPESVAKTIVNDLKKVL